MRQRMSSMGTICWGWGWGVAMLTGALSEWVLQLVAVLFWLPLLLWLLSSGALPASRAGTWVINPSGVAGQS